jgi:dTMP kinase
VPVATSQARVAARSRASGAAIDRLEREDDAFHARVRAGYLELARADAARFVVLDGSRPPEDVANAALAALVSKFAL